MRATLTLREVPCDDTMADQTFPFEAELELGETVLTGCGGDPRVLLASVETWVVDEIGGDRVPNEPAVTLSFDATEALSGSGGCNRFTSRYTVTGEGVSFGPIAATRMACPGPVMDQEARLFAALERVFAFDIADDGSLVLLGPEGPLIVARAP